MLAFSMFDWDNKAYSNITQMKVINTTQSLQQKDNGQSSKDNNALITVLGPMVGAASAAVAIATYYFQKKQYKFNTLIQVFTLLSNENHIESREKVYLQYTKYLINKDVGMFDQPEIKRHVELVKADFEEIGALIKNELIDKKTIFDAYGSMVCNNYDYLEDHINAIKQKNQVKYMDNFESLAKEAKDYLRVSKRSI